MSQCLLTGDTEHREQQRIGQTLVKPWTTTVMLYVHIRNFALFKVAHMANRDKSFGLIQRVFADLRICLEQ